MRRRVAILGVTGSIGKSTQAVIEELRRDRGWEIEVAAITAARDVEGLAQAAAALQPELAVIADPALGEAARAQIGGGVRIAVGPEGLIEAAESADWVISAIVGAAAMGPTLAAIRRGAMVALANKECLVCAGPLLRAEAAKAKATLLPVDSEHSAIFQVLDARQSVEKVTLTASGGPFRTWTLSQMAAATPAQACKHPTWAMGAKISVDSATLMNKGLELIEAAHLFDLSERQLDVLVHPQSIVHALVAYCDGSVLAQLAAPDMRTPIGLALAWPERCALATPRLDLAALSALTFEAPDLQRFPALKLAREALKAGGGAPIVLNAANETAVEAFLEGAIGFLDLAAIVEESLNAAQSGGMVFAPSSFDEVMVIDQWTRTFARSAAAKRAA